MLPQSNNPNSAGLTDKKALLRSHPFFTRLDGQVVERLVLHALTRKVERGTLLFRKGDAGRILYAVCTGAVRVSAPSDQEGRYLQSDRARRNFRRSSVSRRRSAHGRRSDDRNRRAHGG